MTIATVDASLEVLINRSIRDKVTPDEEKWLLAPERVDAYIHELSRIERNITAQIERRKVSAANQKRRLLQDDKAALFKFQDEFQAWLVGAERIRRSTHDKLQNAHRVKNSHEADDLLIDVVHYLQSLNTARALSLVSELKKRGLGADQAPETIT
jgi:hypothetical protein